MKPADQFGVTILAGGTLALLGLCAHFLEMPPVLGAVCVVLGILILIEASYRLKKAGVRGPDTHGTMMPHDASLRARIRFFWFVAFGLVLACVLFIPVLPYVIGGDSSSQFLYAVIPAQIAVVAAFLFYLRRRLFSQRDTDGEEGA